MHTENLSDYSIYKYNLKYFIDQLPKKWDYPTIAEHLTRQGITLSSLEKHVSIKQDDQRTIREKTLRIYAHFLDISVNQLYNYDVPDFPTAKQIDDTGDHSALANRLGLSFKKK